MAITFTHAHYLSLLILIPVIVIIHFLSLRYQGGKALKFANFEAISRIKGIDIYSKNILILSLTVTISILLIFALSGLTVHRIADASSSSFVIAIDSSKSMEADDMIPNRMEAAKKTAIDFVDLAPAGTKVGVISFSGNSYIEQEVTQDKSLIKKAIRDIDISSIGGTDLYGAIITSTNLLKSEEVRAMILLSDGQLNVGGLDEMLTYANTHNVMIHTIAIGTSEGGVTSYGISKLDEESLKSIAYTTDGEFFRAIDTEEISQSFNQILDLKKQRVSFDLSIYLTIAALILFILEFVLLNTKYRSFL